MFFKSFRKSNKFSVLSRLNWRNNFVCIDLNGEMYNTYAGYRREFSNILRLTPAEKDTLNFNILDEITKERSYRDASMIADTLLLQIDRKTEGSFKNYVDSAKDLLTGGILHCKCSDYRYKSISGVLLFLSSHSEISDCGNKSKSILDEMINSMHCSDEIHEIICNAALRLKQLPKNKFKYTLSLVLNALKAFDDPAMRNFSGSSDFCLNDFNAMDKPVSLFITVSVTSIETVFPYILAVLNMLNYTLPDNKTANTQVQKRPILVLLDEFFDNKNYFTNIETGRRSDIKIHFSKFRFDNKKNFLFELMYKKKINLPVPETRDEFLTECADTIKAEQKSKQWFHIPEEMYMCSQEILIEPIFTSRVPDNNECEQNFKGFSGNGKKKKNKSKDIEIIDYEKIENIDLFFNSDIKEHINKLEAILQESNFNKIKYRFSKKGQKCGVICMLFGEPGTGKSEVVQQLAKKTKRNLLKVDVSIIRKRYVGQSEKAVNKMFSLYRKEYEKGRSIPILFINEADGLFQKRIGNIEDSSNQTLAMDFNTMQNLILDKLECFEGILIGTSNFIENMDKAFERRILYKINFDKPDKDTQKQIWKNKMPELENDVTEKLTDNFNFTGGIINNIVKKREIDYILTGEEANYDNLKELCKMEFQLKKKEITIGFV